MDFKYAAATKYDAKIITEKNAILTFQKIKENVSKRWTHVKSMMKCNVNMIQIMLNLGCCMPTIISAFWMTVELGQPVTTK